MKLIMTRRAFSLIEAVVVLAVVALVIGGIWGAASAIRSAQRINDLATAIIQVAKGAQQLFPYDTYPTATGGISVTTTAFNAGLAPKDYTLTASAMRSPYGATLTVGQSCYSVCPMLVVSIQGPASTTGSKLTAAECTQVLRKFAGRMPNANEFLYAQITIPGNSSYAFLYPPINPALAVCPANVDYVNFWFKP